MNPAPSPEVVQIICLPPSYGWEAMNKIAQFFEMQGQLKETFRANDRWNLKVAFRDHIQAEAFAEAIRQGMLNN